MMEDLALGLFNGPVSEKDAIEKFTEDAMKIAELCEKAERRLKRALELVDMEEQGRLVVLPCKVGDSFFVIADVCLCPPNENGCDECDKCSECRYAEQEIRERKFKSVVQIINAEKNFGKTVFLTREQAEEALKGGAE